MVKRKDFRWRYEPPINSNKAKLLSYIQNQSLHPFEEKTAMIMTALTAYYMPLALYNDGNCSRENLELIFLDGVSAIAKHLQYVCITIKIDPAIIGQIFCPTFERSQTETPSSIENRSQTIDIEEEIDSSDLNMWNLVGITTDSETFSD
ncbi:hypothetical protein [Calothrix sp. UHCC 0171]|uniref:hypothetical protein n=1 Tax=Calothrix sp. UHCC 0171 TaxID=3110245 RepID=UPI002B205241|nr:hypothetical protein [Calothrix sp. UHCC 0171]MEA5574803.1 hypothetical protein [Calothrix sp. UHCC 0171]